MKAYSIDLRQRVLEALERGMSRKEAVTTFQVSEGSIKRWLKLRREGRPLQGGQPSGRRATFTPAEDIIVRQLVQDHPDATLPEYTDFYNASNHKPISHWTLGRVIRRLGLTRKKRA